MEDVTYYQAPEYSPPGVVVNVGAMLKAARMTYSTKFSDVFSLDREAQYSYAHGLLLVATIILCIFIAWALILVVLKLKGKEVGCASGQPFQTPNSDDLHLAESTDFSSYSSGVDQLDTDSNEGSNGLRNLQAHANQPNHELDSTGTRESYEDEYASHDGWLESSSKATKERANRREKRTRAAFLFFCGITLMCVPFILVFSFAPMKEATKSTEKIVWAARDALDQIKTSLNTIESAATSADEIVKETPIDLDVLCPQIDPAQIKVELGIDLNEMVSLLESEYQGLSQEVNRNVSTVGKLIDDIETGLYDFEDSVNHVESLMWIVPGFLFAVSLLAAISMLGVLLAWKEKSGRVFQRAMTYVILPTLIVVSIACWVVVLCTSVGAMVSSDMCTAGNGPGSPDETIQQILSTHNLGQNDTVFKLLNAYTNQCSGPDPTEDVVELENMVQDTIDNIWQQISTVDSIGRAQLVEKCGGTRLNDLFTGARNVAKLLTVIRRALSSASSSLECDRINPIYIQAAHESVCTNTAAGAAYGFILFLVLGISTMTMISLRTAWLRNIQEEKVYHDEDEVAENMILDEHEEYLHYISKYKHEWQEYNGFNENRRQAAEGFFEDEEGSAGSVYSEDGVPVDRYGDNLARGDGEGYQGSEEYSDSEPPSDDELHVEILPSSLKLTTSVEDGARGIDLDDISFLSLNGKQSEDSSVDEELLFLVPSPMLPPPSNPSFNEGPAFSLPSHPTTLEERRSPFPRSLSAPGTPSRSQLTPLSTTRKSSSPYSDGDGNAPREEMATAPSMPGETASKFDVMAASRELEKRVARVLRSPYVDGNAPKGETATAPSMPAKTNSKFDAMGAWQELEQKVARVLHAEGEEETQLSPVRSATRQRSFSSYIGEAEKNRRGAQASAEDFIQSPDIRSRTRSEDLRYRRPLSSSTSTHGSSVTFEGNQTSPVSKVKRQASQYKPPSAEKNKPATPQNGSSAKLKPLVQAFERTTYEL